MLEKANRIRLLVRKYLAEELSVQEKVELDNWLSHSEENKKLLELFSDDILFDRIIKEYAESAKVASTFEIADVEAEEHGMVVTVKKIPVFKWVAVASVVLVAGVSIYYLLSERNKPALSVAKPQITNQQKEIMPANGSAILVLDDGRKVTLDSFSNGTVANESGKVVVKKDGQLDYQGNSKAVVYNSLVTTKGRIMSVSLADNSRVWLNAESSIRFPTDFPGDERIVEVTGEAYFDVAKNAKKPFKVLVKKANEKVCEIQVTGTHFNVNAYSDENGIKAALLEGRISVVKGNVTKSLVPGQQAAIIMDQIDVFEGNTDAEVAWKERNFFHFKNNDIKTVMRQLARWYDITVRYEGNLSTRTFSGQVSRELNLSAVLNMLEKADVRFTLNGNEVVVKD